MATSDQPDTFGPRIVGLLVQDGQAGDRIFDVSANPDGLFAKWSLLRAEFAHHGILLTTVLPAGRKADFELHINARKQIDHPLSHVVLSECALIHSLNGEWETLRRYRQRFAWNVDLIEAGKAINIQLGNRLRPQEPDGFPNRHLLCALIAANKALPVRNDERDLYKERVRTIRWFERNASGDFQLYGAGWNLSPKRPGIVGRLLHRIEEVASWKRRKFPSWHGVVQTKASVLGRSRFAICYENATGFRGYITEKVFDAFSAGCVPVYWGAPNVLDCIPAECFIDRRAFATHEKLYACLKAMPEKTYRQYQEAIRGFLESPRAYPFSAECFAETVASHIVADLKEQGIAL